MRLTQRPFITLLDNDKWIAMALPAASPPQVYKTPKPEVWAVLNIIISNIILCTLYLNGGPGVP